MTTPSPVDLHSELSHEDSHMDDVDMVDEPQLQGDNFNDQQHEHEVITLSPTPQQEVRPLSRTSQREVTEGHPGNDDVSRIEEQSHEPGTGVGNALRRLSLAEYQGSKSSSLAKNDTGKSSLLLSADAQAKVQRRDIMGRLQEAEQSYRKDLEMLERTVDDTIRHFKTKALEMTYQRYVRYQQRAIAAGYIADPALLSSTAATSSTTTSVHQDNNNTPIESKDINLKRIPVWDVQWKTEHDLEMFMTTMDNFWSTTTHSGKRSFAEGVACQCWMATLKNLGGKAFILATQIKNANSWDEMQSLFRDWFAKGDKTNNALFFETLVWSKEMPIARFGQMFKSAAEANGFLTSAESEDMRIWLAHRFLRSFPTSWTFAELMTKHNQGPPLDDLIKQAIAEQRVHPNDCGTGKYQRVVPKLAELIANSGVTSFSKDRTSFGSQKEANAGSKPTDGRKRNLQEMATSDSTKKDVTCYGCGGVGHIRPHCPNRATKKANTGGQSKQKGKGSIDPRSDSNSGKSVRCTSLTKVSPMLQRCSNADVHLFDILNQVDRQEQTVLSLVVPSINKKHASDLSSYFFNATGITHASLVIRVVNLVPNLDDPRCISLPMFVNDCKCLAVIDTGSTVTCVSTL